ncbi:MAG TPA: adenylate/guanylate cyclase domain-containing protein, partial [Acidimicrobiales bacterium]|nr:adenylate/guanylate cyclase domain-containing protein [Acidimicrobiales bacterium]
MCTQTLTFLFTDIEGSTRLWENKPDEMRLALARHDDLMRSAIKRSGGQVFKTVGDAFCAVFEGALDAVRSAAAAQRAIESEAWPQDTTIRVRMGVHSGTCEERDDDFFGPTVNRTARLEAAAHGGQVLISGAASRLLGDVLPQGMTLTDLGEHRLKDLSEPLRIFQLDIDGLRTDFPPVRSLDNPRLRNNLPVQVTAFVGRVREMEDVRRLMTTSRLVTLTGAGGVGKSRLAMQLGAELIDGSGHGVWLVELATVVDPDAVPLALVEAIGLREEPGRSVDETLITLLRERSLLIILDNCEHLLGSCAKTVDLLLRECPEVAVLATSRQPLGVVGEQLYRVPSLSLPVESTSPSDLSRFDAIQLFLERARAHDP